MPQSFLAYGSHNNPDGEKCFAEWMNWCLGNAHSDRVPCMDPFVNALGIDTNDSLTSNPILAHHADRLIPWGFRVLGTANDGLQQERHRVVYDWLLHVSLPWWFRCAKLDAFAAELEATPEWDGKNPETVALARRAAWAAGAVGAAGGGAWGAGGAWAAGAAGGAWAAGAAGAAGAAWWEAHVDGWFAMLDRVAEVGEKEREAPELIEGRPERVLACAATHGGTP